MSTPFKMKGSPMQRNFGISPIKQGLFYTKKSKYTGKTPTINPPKSRYKGKTPTLPPPPVKPKGPHTYTLKKTETRINK